MNAWTVEAGQVLVETLLLCLALVLALLLPIHDGQSVGVWLASSLVEWFRGQSFVLSLY